MKKVFSFDAETLGLWGPEFAIAALVYDESGEEISRFLGRRALTAEEDKLADSIKSPDGKFDLRRDVIDVLDREGVTVTHADRPSLLADFAKFYLANKQDAAVVVHMGTPVESTLLRELHTRGLIGDWDGPFPLLDIADGLRQAGENPTSVDAYVAKYQLAVRDFGTPHNPLYDAEAAARVFLHLQSRVGK